MSKHVVWRGVIGGLGMGIVAMLFPLTLFSGDEHTIELIQQATKIGFIILIDLAVCKLLETSLLLTNGWKGGYVFPVMFAGVALGMAAHLLYPNSPIAVSVAATLAGVWLTALKAPLFSAFFTLLLILAEFGPVVAVAVLVSTFLLLLLAARNTQTPTRVRSSAAQN